MKIFNTIKKFGSRAWLNVKYISPELALGAGILCGIGAVVVGCMASRKVDMVVEDINADLDVAEEHLAEAETKEEVKEAKKEVMGVWTNGAWQLTKLYGPTLILGGASIALVLTSHGILKNRYLSTAAAYKALDEAYKAYREHVATQFGLGDGENALAAQSFCKDVKVKNEDGTIEDARGLVMDANKKKSPYEFDFNRYTAPQTWSSDPTQNDILLRTEQNYANDLLMTRGHVFLNEVLDRLGLERTATGQIVGWFKGAGDDYVDFGYLNGFISDWNIDSDLCRKNIRLNFNCDGVIYDMLRKKA